MVVRLQIMYTVIYLGVVQVYKYGIYYNIYHIYNFTTMGVLPIYSRIVSA